MATFEALVQAQAAYEEQAKPLVANFEAYQKKHHAKLEELAAPYRLTMEAFLDAVLKDKNGNSIREGDLITNGRTTYIVIGRGIQAFLGNLLNSPRCSVKLITKGQSTASPNARVLYKHSSDLKEFEIVERPKWKSA